MTWRARSARRGSGGFCATLGSGSKPRRSSRRVSFPLPHAAGSLLGLPAQFPLIMPLRGNGWARILLTWEFIQIPSQPVTETTPAWCLEGRGLGGGSSKSSPHPPWRVPRGQSRPGGSWSSPGTPAEAGVVGKAILLNEVLLEAQPAGGTSFSGGLLGSSRHNGQRNVVKLQHIISQNNKEMKRAQEMAWGIFLNSRKRIVRACLKKLHFFSRQRSYLVA